MTNLKDKLHDVYYLNKWRGLVRIDKTISLLDYLKKQGNTNGDEMWGGVLFTGADVFNKNAPEQLYERGTFSLAENRYVLTGEELLAIKKQWASEAWDKLISSLIDLKAHTPGKQAFIDNLTI